MVLYLGYFSFTIHEESFVKITQFHSLLEHTVSVMTSSLANLYDTGIPVFYMAIRSIPRRIKVAGLMLIALRV